MYKGPCTGKISTCSDEPIITNCEVIGLLHSSFSWNVYRYHTHKILWFCGNKILQLYHNSTNGVTRDFETCHTLSTILVKKSPAFERFVSTGNWNPLAANKHWQTPKKWNQLFQHKSRSRFCPCHYRVHNVTSPNNIFLCSIHIFNTVLISPN